MHQPKLQAAISTCKLFIQEVMVDKHTIPSCVRQPVLHMSLSHEMVQHDWRQVSTPLPPHPSMLLQGRHWVDTLHPIHIRDAQCSGNTHPLNTTNDQNMRDNKKPCSIRYSYVGTTSTDRPEMACETNLSRPWLHHLHYLMPPHPLS